MTNRVPTGKRLGKRAADALTLELVAVELMVGELMGTLLGTPPTER